MLSALLVLALVAAGIAVTQQRAAQQQRDVAVSQRVATQALELRSTNSALAAQLGLAAYRLVPTAEARGSLLSTVANPDVTRRLGSVSFHLACLLRNGIGPGAMTEVRVNHQRQEHERERASGAVSTRSAAIE